MKEREQAPKWTRRGFLHGAGLLGLGGAVASIGDTSSEAAAPKKIQAPPAASAYDMDRLRKVDLVLIAYEQTGTFRAPHPEPKRIVAAAGDEILVAAGKHINLLDGAGTSRLEIKLGDDVCAVAVAPDGSIYAALKEKVEVFSREGKNLTSWKAKGKSWLTSLALGENGVFVADASNRIVLRYDRSGKFLGRIGEKDKARGVLGFMVPSPYFDLEVGSDGLLWVVNPGNHRLEAYTFEGRIESYWGEPNFGIKGFCGCCNPSYFTRMADGRFVTSEKGLTRIKIYSAKGEFESVVAAPDAFPKYAESGNITPIPVDIAADAKGRILVADTLGNQIRIYERKKS